MVVEEGGRGSRREKKRESTRSDQTASMAERAATPLSISVCWIHTGETKRLCRREPKIAERKGVHFGHHRSRVSVHEALTLHSPVAHPRPPCLRGGSVKAARCGVSVLGAERCNVYHRVFGIYPLLGQGSIASGALGVVTT